MAVDVSKVILFALYSVKEYRSYIIYMIARIFVRELKTNAHLVCRVSMQKNPLPRPYLLIFMRCCMGAVVETQSEEPSSQQQDLVSAREP